MSYNGYINWNTWKINLELINNKEEYFNMKAEDIKESISFELSQQYKEGSFVEAVVNKFINEIDFDELEEVLVRHYHCGLCEKSFDYPAEDPYCSKRCSDLNSTL